jgi:hypothetical protein
MRCLVEQGRDERTVAVGHARWDAGRATNAIPVPSTGGLTSERSRYIVDVSTND